MDHRVVLAFGVRGVLWCAAGLLAWMVIPVAAGWHVEVVRTGSMAPALEPGDVVAFRPVRGGMPRLGQIVLVKDPAHAGRMLSHRVVENSGTGTLRTKGDADTSVDSTPVPVPAVLGVGQLRVAWLGLPVLWWHQHRPVPLLLTVCGVLLLLRVAGSPSVRRRPRHGYSRRAVAGTVVALLVASAADKPGPH
jgi:signal peptidase